MLGGGGARGISQIGILQSLEDHGMLPWLLTMVTIGYYQHVTMVTINMLPWLLLTCYHGYY